MKKIINRTAASITFVAVNIVASAKVFAQSAILGAGDSNNGANAANGFPVQTILVICAVILVILIIATIIVLISRRRAEQEKSGDLK